MQVKDPAEYIGLFARSIESGWLGKVVSVEELNGDVMLRMQGVNELCLTVAGGRLSDWIDDDDVQWFDPFDLKFYGKEKA